MASQCDETAKRLADKEGVQYKQKQGPGPEISSNRRDIKVVTAESARDGVRELQGCHKPVYIACADPEATAEAMKATQRTTVGVMDSEGKIIKHSTRRHRISKIVTDAACKMEFKPYQTSYHYGNAYWMARLADAVYICKIDSKDPDKRRILNALNHKNEGAKFTSVEGFNEKSAQAIVVGHPEYISIAFRGTDELADWLDNINILPTNHLFGSFHRGFYNSVKDVWKGIEDEVHRLKEEDRARPQVDENGNVKIRPVWFTGHSLGGAMASIAAAIYIHDDRPFFGIYTFGQPRCMDRKTARIFDMGARGRCFRFQNNNDIVTRVPARLMGYGHVERCIYITRKQELYDDPGLWLQFKDSVTGALGAILEKGIDAIEDHDMKDYLEAIARWGKNPLASG